MNSRVARYVTSCVSVWKLINLLALVTVCSVSAALPMSLHNALSAAEHTARLTDRLSNHCSKQLLETAFGRTLLRKVYTVNAAICIAHRHEHVSNALPLPVSRRWSPLASRQPGISEHCETTDTGWCVMRYACLLPQLSPGTHSSLHRGQAQADSAPRWFTRLKTVTHLATNRS